LTLARSKAVSRLRLATAVQDVFSTSGHRAGYKSLPDGCVDFRRLNSSIVLAETAGDDRFAARVSGLENDAKIPLQNSNPNWSAGGSPVRFNRCHTRTSRPRSFCKGCNSSFRVLFLYLLQLLH
jgi:hypothetical protein